MLLRQLLCFEIRSGMFGAELYQLRLRGGFVLLQYILGFIVCQPGQQPVCVQLCWMQYLRQRVLRPRRKLLQLR